MRLLDFTFEQPTANLALDEVLLDRVASGHAPPTLRFWESATPFVVIGSGQRCRDVVHVFNCLRDGVPVLRRCSAGGAVLQGPGCLNFALALRYSEYPEAADLHGSYAYIMGRVAEALNTLGIDAQRAGISDLEIESRKVSGNAQRRKSTACLHHGTLLHAVDIEAMARYLAEPADRPDYRGTRSHAEFVGALPARAAQLRAAVAGRFAPQETAEAPLPAEIEAAHCLAREKYLRDAWTYRR